MSPLSKKRGHQTVEKASQSLRPQAQIEFHSFSPAARDPRFCYRLCFAVFSMVFLSVCMGNPFKSESTFAGLYTRPLPES